MKKIDLKLISNNLPPGALRDFEAVGRLGSFTQAARALTQTQSAIGQPLFVRANRAIHLTDAGVDFLRITRDVLNGLGTRCRPAECPQQAGFPHHRRAACLRVVLAVAASARLSRGLSRL